MRKRIGTGVLAFLMLAALAAPALAARPEDQKVPGIYDLTFAAQDVYSVSITINDEVFTATTDKFFPNAEKMTVTVDNPANNVYYLITAQTSTTVPTDENLVYIDQDTGKASFNVYPSQLADGPTYYIMLSDSSNSKQTEVASFKYYMPYMPGDVDGDKVITSADALMALQIAGELITPTPTEYAAANVDGDDVVTSGDALKILQYAGNIIHSWDE